MDTDTPHHPTAAGLTPDPAGRLDMNAVVGRRDLVLLTLDTLRFDVADAEMKAGRTPNLARLLPGGWEARHTPGSFTWAAHQAFFAGFFPTPTAPGPHGRPLALAFGGSATVTPETRVFDAPDLVTGLRAEGYHAICIGGTGFFNLQTPLSRVIPGLFDEAHWSPPLGVTDPQSAANQLSLARDRILALPDRRVFLFVNVAAIHQPNWFYAEDAGAREAGGPARRDTLASHAAALREVDRRLPLLLDALRGRPVWGIVCADHGTLYGEDGHTGHRVAHPAVWTVPYGEFGWT